NANAAGYGGMLTFLAIGGTVAGTDTVGPDTSAVTLSPSETNGINDSVAITAQVSDGAAGNGTIAAAEYYIDDNAGTPTAMNATDGTFNGTTEAVQATITAATVATL
ncbi:MAG: hypothetical protein KDE31_16725, partial [Caldilineaceae bacterium]|nr:hypothetical protein [Caldilineaceae bacterium]